MDAGEAKENVAGNDGERQFGRQVEPSKFTPEQVEAMMGEARSLTEKLTTRWREFSTGLIHEFADQYDGDRRGILMQAMFDMAAFGAMAQSLLTASKIDGNVKPSDLVRRMTKTVIDAFGNTVAGALIADMEGDEDFTRRMTALGVTDSGELERLRSEAKEQLDVLKQDPFAMMVGLEALARILGEQGAPGPAAAAGIQDGEAEV